jgi:hypothetical protein
MASRCQDVLQARIRWSDADSGHKAGGPRTRWGAAAHAAHGVKVYLFHGTASSGTDDIKDVKSLLP